MILNFFIIIWKKVCGAVFGGCLPPVHSEDELTDPEEEGEEGKPLYAEPEHHSQLVQTLSEVGEERTKYFFRFFF